MYVFQMPQTVVLSREFAITVQASETWPSSLMDLEVSLHVPLLSRSHMTPKTWTSYRSDMLPNVLAGPDQYHELGLGFSRSAYFLSRADRKV